MKGERAAVLKDALSSAGGSVGRTPRRVLPVRTFLADVGTLAGAILVSGIVALAIAAIWLHMPMRTAVAIARFWVISGGISLFLGSTLLWLVGSSARLGLRLRLTVALAAGGLIALLNVLVTAWLMFISPHDLALLFLLLLFSLFVSLSFAALLSRAFATSLRRLTTAARRLAEGDLSVRVTTAGGGELADLAHDFNRMAERLEAAFARERQLDAARRSLVASVSHDLRSPLASLRAAVEALHDGVVSEPEEVQRYQRAVLQETTHLSRLIDDLFELARLDAGATTLAIERTALGDLISDTIESARPRAAQQGVTVDGTVTGPLVVQADAAKVQRVLDNLISNALRHTSRGGSIRLTARQADGEIWVEVCDTGEGIPAEDVPLVFDRFYRGDRARDHASGGAGLGLAIAKGLVEAHDGRIWLQSVAGCGTTVTFTLPCAGPDRRQAVPLAKNTAEL